MEHCCFAGCSPRPCGCCVRMAGHKDGCDSLDRMLDRLDRKPVPERDG